MDRRPIKTRGHKWAIQLTHFLIKSGVKPNHISLCSILMAALAATALISSLHTNQFHWGCYLTAAIFIQARLICNLLDGMVAVEGNISSKVGDIYNDLPDRISDSLIIVPIGYLATPLPFAIELGWLAAIFAIFIAYIRLLGGSLKLKQSFIGPMAKPHRMAAITFACIIASFMNIISQPATYIFHSTLIIILLGSIITAYRRTKLIANQLNNQP